MISDCFQNPLQQGQARVTAVGHALQIAPEHIHPVVAFIGNCRFTNRMPRNVTQGSGFVLIASITRVSHSESNPARPVPYIRCPSNLDEERLHISPAVTRETSG